MGEEASKECIKYAKLGDIEKLKHLYETNPDVRDSYVYQRVLLSACANNQLSVAKWLLEIYSSFDFKNSKVGVYGKIVRLDYIIKDNDRIEIYEPIKTTAKVRRSKLVENKK